MSVRVAIAQMKVDPHSRATNQRRAMALLDQAAELDPPPELICLPGLCDGGSALPPPTPAMTDSFAGILSAKARELGVHVVAGMLESAAGGVYDTAIWLDADGDEILKHRRIHLAGGPDGLKAGERALACQNAYGRAGLLVGPDAGAPRLVAGLAELGVVLIVAVCAGSEPATAALQEAARRGRVWLIAARPAADGAAGSQIFDPGGCVQLLAGPGERIDVYDLPLEYAQSC